jgi:hypothetical protein
MVAYLPSEWSAMSSLSELEISNNQFIGPLPSSWSSIPLVYVTMSNNQLSGPLPASRGSINTMHELYLSNNQIA